jgi:hypothetical protein
MLAMGAFQGLMQILAETSFRLDQRQRARHLLC